MILMQNIYTEPMLIDMEKTDLYDILLSLEIEVNKNTAKEKMIDLILAKENESTDDSKVSNEVQEEDEDDDDDDDDDDGLPKFTLDQLIASSTYSHRRDVLRTLLNDGKMYSHGDVARIFKRFYDKAVT